MIRPSLNRRSCAFFPQMDLKCSAFFTSSGDGPESKILRARTVWIRNPIVNESSKLGHCYRIRSQTNRSGLLAYLEQVPLKVIRGQNTIAQNSITQALE